jgi:hypothetical protein
VDEHTKAKVRILLAKKKIIGAKMREKRSRVINRTKKGFGVRVREGKGGGVGQL